MHKLVPSNNKSVCNHSHILALGGALFKDDFLRQKGAESSFEADLIAGDFLNKALNFPRGSRKSKNLFREGGLAVLSNNLAWLCVSCGTNGQNLMGGHGHNDKNSFELNVDDDYIVDGGCPVYTSNPRIRNKYRSTFAHSTLSVNGMEQDKWNEGIAGLFILEQKCKPNLKMFDTAKIEGVHSGYGNKHVRTFFLQPTKLEITDYCAIGKGKNLLLNLDPKVSVKDISVSNLEMTAILQHTKGRRIVVQMRGVMDPEVVDGYYSEGFGIPLPIRC